MYNLPQDIKAYGISIDISDISNESRIIVSLKLVSELWSNGLHFNDRWTDGVVDHIKISENLMQIYIAKPLNKKTKRSIYEAIYIAWKLFNDFPNELPEVFFGVISRHNDFVYKIERNNQNSGYVYREIGTSDIYEKDLITFSEIWGTKNKTSRQVPAKLRMQVFKEDNFTCCICGMAKEKYPTLELHVDHIIPWAKGGETIRENLQTLCAYCNFGKGDSLEDD